MILKYLSSSAIQSEIGEAVLSRLETLLPAISIDIDATDVYNKDTLVKILTSFSTESLFKKKDFLSLLIDSIPTCLLYTSPSPRDRTRSRMPSSA